MVLTIGRPSRGICGSGLIDSWRSFLRRLIDRNGKFRRDQPRTGYVSEKTAGVRAHLCTGTSIGRDIAVSEADLDNLIRTKARSTAMQDAPRQRGLTFADLDRFIIAVVGRHLDIETPR